MTQNEVALTNEDDNYDPYEKLEKELSNQRIVGKLLKFTKLGVWVAGQEEDEVPFGTQLLVYMSGLHDGYVHWSDGKPDKWEIGLVSMDHPRYGANRFRVKDRSELDDNDSSTWPLLSGEPNDPWQRTFYCIMVDPNTEELYTYTPQSKGGKQCIGRVIAAWNAHKKTHGDAEQPIVELGGSSYEHQNKQFGDIQYPVMKVIGYTDELPHSLIDLGLTGMANEVPAVEAAPPAKAIAPPQKPVQAAPAPVKAQVRQAPGKAPTPPPKGGGNAKQHGKGARF